MILQVMEPLVLAKLLQKQMVMERATTHGSTFLTAGEIHSSTGEVLYIDNRAAVTRSADQTEDIKIVIQI